MNLETAEKLANFSLEVAAQNALNPLSVTVLDAGGNLKVFKKQDGTGLFTIEISKGKALGSLGFSMDSSDLAAFAERAPAFMNAAYAATKGLIPIPGGILIKRKSTKEIIGAVGISGDSSQNDESCAVEAVRHLQVNGEDLTCNKIDNGAAPVLKSKLHYKMQV